MHYPSAAALLGQTAKSNMGLDQAQKYFEKYKNTTTSPGGLGKSPR